MLHDMDPEMDPEVDPDIAYGLAERSEREGGGGGGPTTALQTHKRSTCYAADWSQHSCPPTR